MAGLPVRFVGSFPDPGVKLDPPNPEIAFIGRSNSGKSSLLNALVAKPGLARVSATPGKTQLLNVYALPDLYLVDLPGYGWARTSKSTRSAFRKLVEGYLRHRSQLYGVVWLLDIRHDPSVEDLALHQLLVDTARPVITVLTKGDKLPMGQRRAAALARARSLGLDPDDLLITSSKTGLGIADLGLSILAAVQP